MLRAAGRAYVAVACGLFSMVLLLVVVDSVVGPARVAPPWPGRRASIPFYAGQPWAERLAADEATVGSATMYYRPFTVWRRPPFSSETVNVGPDGRRVVPGSECGAGAKEVWFFGGSTMWGQGSPDRATIPALFLEEMRKRTPGPTCVRNFGESGWVSTQEVIALLLALQRGEKPDVAVFYDGANDLFFTFENGDAYGHADLGRIAAIFDRGGRGRGERRPAARSPRDLLQAFAPNLAARLDGALPVARAARGGARRKPAELAAEAVRVLRVNREVVRALAARFGFEAHFFWQPRLADGRKRLPPGEEAIMAAERTHRPDFVEVVQQANAIVADGTYADETNLSRVFEGTTDQVYTDPVHVTPQGNEIVARAIAQVLGDRIAGESIAGGR